MFNMEDIKKIAEYRVHVETLLDVIDAMVKAGYEPSVLDGRRIDIVREALETDVQTGKAALEDFLNKYHLG